MGGVMDEETDAPLQFTLDEQKQSYASQAIKTPSFKSRRETVKLAKEENKSRQERKQIKKNFKASKKSKKDTTKRRK